MLSVAEVVIENALPAFDIKYSYLIPKALEQKPLVGCRVRIPFGRGNRKRTGFVLSLSSLPKDKVKGFKKLDVLLDDTPIIDKEGLVIIQYLKEFTFCTWYDAVRLLIPTGLDITPSIVYTARNPVTDTISEKQREILSFVSTRRGPAKEDALLKTVEIEKDDPDLLFLLEQEYLEKAEEFTQRIQDDRVTMVRPTGEEPMQLTRRQTEVLDFLLENPDISIREACYYAGTSRSVLNALEEKGAAEFYEIIRSRGGFDKAEADDIPLPILSPAQEAAYETIKENYNTAKPCPTLLYGVTGSGKTQVFLELIAQVIQDGKGVIVMVPEISLTSQTIRSLQSRFGNLVAVLHSGLSLGERRDEWLRIQSGEASIVVGTRSAVFAPLPSLGLIVMDEEQEHTYKSDRSPRFHARDIARLRCRYHDALLLLCSATPSIETYYYAKNGRYQLVTLPDRFGESKLPAVEVIDMRQPENLSASLTLSEVLLSELRYNLDHGEQSILLLNRRGYSTVVTCTSCATAVECPHCSVPMTYHTANNQMVCHYCGYSQKRITVCSHCGSELIRYSGIGTQQLEEELSALFGEARILRMDMDTTMSRYAHEDMFTAFQKGEYDIMIGTQMVAKGLNFPLVTLVGVLNADQALYSDDFRSYERSFALLTQVVGRSGRGEYPGRAFIQTYTPEHSIIHYATAQDYPAFYQEEIAARQLTLYPPFCSMVGIGFVGEQLSKVQDRAFQFAKEFRKKARQDYPDLPFRVLGPSPGEVLKVAGRYRYKLVVKCRNDKKTREFFANMLQWYYEKFRDVSIFIDMYYERM